MGATSTNPEEISQLSVEAEGSGVVVRRDIHLRECWRPAGNTSWSPTLILSIRVPPGMEVLLEEEDSADYSLGTIGGPLSADISGRVTLAAARVTSLNLFLSGEAQVTIGTVAGAVSLGASGHALVRITNVAAPTFRADLSGSGRLAIDSGSVGTLAVDSSGTAQLVIGGTTGNATVSLSGSGDVRIASLTGTLSKDLSGTGTVEVGR